jgi:hypothetical protein
MWMVSRLEVDEGPRAVQRCCCVTAMTDAFTRGKVRFLEKPHISRVASSTAYSADNARALSAGVHLTQRDVGGGAFDDH